MNGTIVCDIDGVILLGGDPIPGAGPALGELRDMGLGVLLATNNATRTPSQTAERIQRLTGFAADADCVVTSTIAAIGMLGPGDQPVLAAAEPGMAETLLAAGVEVTEDPAAARTVLVGLNRSFTYDLLREAATAVMNGARLIAANTDPTFPTRNGPEPGAGALVAAVERASGTIAEVAGKPHPPMQEAVADRIAPGPVWMVGDRPDTDIAFAIAAGWIPVLVLSGVTADPTEVPPELAPDLVIPSLADLPGVLAQGE